jgi:hypothetical protein
VACYLSEALIAEGSVSAACDLMQAAVERRIAAAAAAAAPAAAAAAAAAGGGGDGDAVADHHLHITHACTLAVGGATSRDLPALPPTPTHTRACGRAVRAREGGAGAGAGGGGGGRRCPLPRLHRAEVSCSSKRFFCFVFAAADA